MSRLVTLLREDYPQTLEGWDAAALTPRAAHAAMWIAQLAYEDDPGKIRAIAASWNLTLVEQNRTGPLGPLLSDGIRWLALRGDGRRVLAFSGTDPLVLSDWRTDLGVPLNGDDIHSGFADGLARARTDLVPALGDDASPIWIVGHSLGAALAALHAFGMARADQAPAAIYGFGMPRVGGARFAAEYERLLGARTYRFVYGSDIVPRLPLPEMGYRHVGRRVACASGGHFDVATLAASPDDDPAVTFDLNPRSLVGAILPFVPRLSFPGRRDLLGLASGLLPALLADHLPDRYWKALS